VDALENGRRLQIDERNDRSAQGDAKDQDIERRNAIEISMDGLVSDLDSYADVLRRGLKVDAERFRSTIDMRLESVRSAQSNALHMGVAIRSELWQLPVRASSIVWAAILGDQFDEAEFDRLMSEFRAFYKPQMEKITLMLAERHTIQIMGFRASPETAKSLAQDPEFLERTAMLIEEVKAGKRRSRIYGLGHSKPIGECQRSDSL
jgi:hypothetical protein